MAEQKETKVGPFFMTAAMIKSTVHANLNVACIGEQCALYMPATGPAGPSDPGCAIMKIALKR